MIETHPILRGLGAKPGRLARALRVLPVVCVSACAGMQSALVPAGRGAAVLAELWWWMAGAALVIWAAVVGLAIYAIRVKDRPHSERAATYLIVGGGAVFPTVVLALLLGYNLWLMPGLLELGPADGLRVEVIGEQYWWRVRYHPPLGEPVELANEVRLPLGERVTFELASPDVIHSFWIPSLGGKMDLIPGRVNEFALEPIEEGIFRGACAEYCGTSHALMNLYAVVRSDSAFAAWLRHQATPAQPPAGALEARGQAAFLANGCGACHRIRGTPADGRVGPDLTHVGSRLSLGAGILPNEPDAFARWIARTAEVKPGVHMPSFGMLPAAQLRALAAYLEGLD